MARILVIDNDPSSGATEPIVSRFPEVRYVPEPRVGLSVARNTGVLRTTGSIVTFTDDDVVVHEGWVEAIRAGFHADHGESVMALTGLVLPAALDTPAPKRKLGYYALPLLWRDRVIGWANVAVSLDGIDAKIGYVSRAPKDRGFKAALDAEIDAMRRFLSEED